MNVISWDLDSTLCHTEHRQGMILEGADRQKTDWVAYSEACAGDDFGPAWDMLVSLQFHTHLGHVVVSRRDIAALPQTLSWFNFRGMNVFEEFMLLKGQFSGPETDHGLWKVAQIKRYEARTGNKVILHVDDAPLDDVMADAGIPFLQVASEFSEFITRPKGLVAG